MTDPKPPLGLMPRWLADEHRLADIDAALGRYKEAGMIPPSEWMEERRDLVRSLLQHRPTDAALAQPEPEAPSDEELFCLKDLSDAWNAQADAVNSWDELGVDEIIWFAQKQALARFAHPTPQPIPVSKYLPGVEDCDKERRCWWHAPETDTKCAVWCLGPGPTCLPPEGFGETHWLPAHALPLPSQPTTDTP